MSDCVDIGNCKACLEQGCLWVKFFDESNSCVPSERPYLDGKEIDLLLYPSDTHLCVTTSTEREKPTSQYDNGLTTTGTTPQPTRFTSDSSPGFMTGMTIGVATGVGLSLLGVILICRWYRRVVRTSITQRTSNPKASRVRRRPPRPPFPIIHSNNGNSQLQPALNEDNIQSGHEHFKSLQFGDQSSWDDEDTLYENIPLTPMTTRTAGPAILTVNVEQHQPPKSHFERLRSLRRPSEPPPPPKHEGTVSLNNDIRSGMTGQEGSERKVPRFIKVDKDASNCCSSVKNVSPSPQITTLPRLQQRTFRLPHFHDYNNAPLE